jgi:hypothetical protein
MPDDKTATQIGIFVNIEPCMVPLPSSAPRSRLTVSTTVFHSGGFPRRSVAGFALSADPGMGPDTTQHLSTLRIQWTRVVEQPALRVNISNDHK